MASVGLILSLVILILSIIAHEVAHGFAADALGDPTARYAGRLTLNPLPHLDLVGSLLVPALLVLSGSPILFGWAKPVPYNPHNLRNRRWGEALVAAAGSATNLLLAVIFGLLARFGGALPQPAVELAGAIAFINLFLGLFNLIPFPPLDGFGVVCGVLPWRFTASLRKFEARMRGFGAAGLIALLLVFSLVLAGPFFALVSWLFGALTGLS